MRVLVLTQHFTPEVTAGTFRVESFTEALGAAGHEVSVVCPVPNHPRGVIEDGYRGRALIRRRVGRASVSYVWVLTRPRKTTAARLSYYGSYAALATLAGSVARRPDVVLASSPPLPVGAAGALVAARHRVPFVFDVRDLWPESAVALGELTDPRLVRLAERLERALYARARLIVSVNHAFCREIAERAPPTARIELIPNGTTREWLEAGAGEVDRSAVGISPDRFVWTYAGNIGLAHGLDVALEAARLLGEAFRLVIIGQGPRRAEIERRAAALPAGLVELRELMPPREAARNLRASDALLVSERQDKTVSAKLYDYCAVGRPIVAAARGELRRVIEERALGLAVSLEDPEELAAAVRRLRDDRELALGLSRKARAFAAEHLRETQAQRLRALLEHAARGAQPAGR